MRNTLRYRARMTDDWNAARAEAFAGFVREAMADESYKDVAAQADMGENTLRNWAKNKLKKGPLAASVMAWARVVGVDKTAALAAAGIGIDDELPAPEELSVAELLRRAEQRYLLLGLDLGELRRRFGA